MILYVSGWLLFMLIVMLAMYLSLHGVSDIHTKKCGLGTKQSRFITLVLIFMWFIFNMIYNSHVSIEYVVRL